jgi:hypothetical protein
MAGKTIYINKRNVKKPKNDMYIWASDEMEWIQALNTTKVGDVVKWAGKSYKILKRFDKLTGESRLTYNRKKGRVAEGSF